MAYAKGFVPLTLLRPVDGGARLLGPCANAYMSMRLAAFMLDGMRIAPAGPYGAGYRDWSTAMVFYHAGQGDLAARKKAHLDPHLNVSIAYPPGSHGGADRMDVLWNGHSPSDEHLEFAELYGWDQEFGSRDRNHLRHDHRTGVNGVRSMHRFMLLGRFYNDRHLGKMTNAERTGRPDASLYWLAQHYGHLRNTYPDRCREDGVTGPNTERAISHEWETLKDAARARM